MTLNPKPHQFDSDNAFWASAWACSKMAQAGLREESTSGRGRDFLHPCTRHCPAGEGPELV